MNGVSRRMEGPRQMETAHLQVASMRVRLDIASNSRVFTFFPHQKEGALLSSSEKWTPIHLSHRILWE